MVVLNGLRGNRWSNVVDHVKCFDHNILKNLLPATAANFRPNLYL